MTGKLPKWDDNEAMVPWVHRKLDELQAEMMRPTGNARKGDSFAIHHAKHGNIEPLRKKYSDLAPFLHALEPETPTKENRNDVIATAVWATEQIKKIWKTEYKLEKRPYRSRDQISADAIAARWLGVKQEDIPKRMNKSGKSGPSGKKKKKL